MAHETGAGHGLHGCWHVFILNVPHTAATSESKASAAHCGKKHVFMSSANFTCHCAPNMLLRQGPWSACASNALGTRWATGHVVPSLWKKEPIQESSSIPHDMGLGQKRWIVKKQIQESMTINRKISLWLFSYINTCQCWSCLLCVCIYKGLPCCSRKTWLPDFQSWVADSDSALSWATRQNTSTLIQKNGNGTRCYLQTTVSNCTGRRHMSWDLAPWGHIACWQKGFF